jgi:hypothetical protein
MLRPVSPQRVQQACRHAGTKGHAVTAGACLLRPVLHPLLAHNQLAQLEHLQAYTVGKHRDASAVARRASVLGSHGIH